MKKQLTKFFVQNKPSNIPENCQWLSGQGAGAWFCIDSTSKPLIYQVKRYNLHGELDCETLMKVADLNFDINQAYQFTYVSHCAKCSIIQQEKVFDFLKV